MVDNPDKIPFWQGVVLSGLSGMVAGGITNPLDMAKLRMQVDRVEKSTGAQARFAYKNVLDGVYQIYAREGVFALFRGELIHRTLLATFSFLSGSLARVLFHTPATAISMGLMENIRIKINASY
jgi:hypothetical protein